jgi:hypothetical protein
MKKILFLALAAAALALCTGLRADGGAADATAADAPHLGPGLKSMQEMLGLSDAQAGQIKLVHEAHRDALKADAGKIKDDLAKISGLVASKGSDWDLSSAITALQSDREAERLEKAKQNDEVLAAMTATQQAQWILSEAEKKKVARSELDGRDGQHRHP